MCRCDRSPISTTNIAAPLPSDDWKEDIENAKKKLNKQKDNYRRLRYCRES
jgi:hypothetical protein